MKNATNIVRKLRDKGFEAYWVGGYVRDMLLAGYTHGNVIPTYSDIDIATDARPEEVIEIFSEHNVVPTGIVHGTVTIMIDKVVHVEVTTYRKDVSCDGRNAVVEYASSIEEDLARRDFTINAIAFNPLTGALIDPHQGANDLKKKVIKAVGEPLDRFKEDYLRIFRAARFAATLGFKIDPETIVGMAKAVSSNNWKSRVSVERIKAEIDKCFKKADKPSVMFTELPIKGVLAKIIPELTDAYGVEQNKHHMYDVFFHTMHTLDAVPKFYPLIRWAALFHDLGKVPARKWVQDAGGLYAWVSTENGDYTFHNHEEFSEKLATKIMKRLKFSVDEMKYINNLVKHHMFRCSDEMRDSAIRRFVSSLGPEYVEDICILKYADRVGNGKKAVTEMDIEATKLMRRFEKILKEECAFKIKDLAIDGNDIMRIKNIPSGPKVGEYLSNLFEVVMEDPSKNTREELERILKEE